MEETNEFLNEEGILFAGANFKFLCTADPFSFCGKVCWTEDMIAVNGSHKLFVCILLQPYLVILFPHRSYFEFLFCCSVCDGRY